MLRDVIHFNNSLINLFYTSRLLLTGRYDLCENISNPLNTAYYVRHSSPCIGGQLRSHTDPLDRIIDQTFNFLCRTGAALSEIAYFGSDYCKSTPLLACSRGLNRCIEREDIRLESDPINDTNDVNDFARCITN